MITGKTRNWWYNALVDIENSIKQFSTKIKMFRNMSKMQKFYKHFILQVHLYCMRKKLVFFIISILYKYSVLVL